MSLRVGDHGVQQIGHLKDGGPEQSGRGARGAAEFAELLQGLVKGQPLVNTGAPSPATRQPTAPVPPPTR